MLKLFFKGFFKWVMIRFNDFIPFKMHKTHMQTTHTLLILIGMLLCYLIYYIVYIFDVLRMKPFKITNI